VARTDVTRREPDAAQVRAERRGAVRRAEEHVRALEQRRDELRDERDHSSSSDRREALRAELAKVQRQIQEADRQLIRAQWALREVEQ
jgi:predicted  nucleic acid-binding Zn-ribbon protein